MAAWAISRRRRAQHYRDARIAPIYEGANGIQAIDLVTRKLPSNGGETIHSFIAGLKQSVQSASARKEPAFRAISERLEKAVADLEETSALLLRRLSEDRAAALAGATAFQRLFGLAAGGAYLAKGALTSASTEAHIVEARHFAESLMGETSGLKHSVVHGHETVNQADAVLGLR